MTVTHVGRPKITTISDDIINDKRVSDKAFRLYCRMSWECENNIEHIYGSDDPIMKELIDTGWVQIEIDKETGDETYTLNVNKGIENG